MTAECPSCGKEQPDGLLCLTCRDALLTMIAAAPQLIEQLDVAASKQARIGSGGGKAAKGSARERSPVNWPAVEARRQLRTEVDWIVGWSIDEIRRHPMAAEMVSGLGKATKRAYSVIDRAQERTYLGTCLYEEQDATCHAEIWAWAGAKEVTCTQCGITHDVAERRAWLLMQAAEMLFTVREASAMLGDVGGIPVTQASIRGYLHRKRIAYRPGGTLIRLGDLLEVVMDEGGRKSA